MSALFIYNNCLMLRTKFGGNLLFFIKIHE